MSVVGRVVVAGAVLVGLVGAPGVARTAPVGAVGETLFSQRVDKPGSYRVSDGERVLFAGLDATALRSDLGTQRSLSSDEACVAGDAKPQRVDIPDIGVRTVPAAWTRTCKMGDATLVEWHSQPNPKDGLGVTFNLGVITHKDGTVSAVGHLATAEGHWEILPTDEEGVYSLSSDPANTGISGPHQEGDGHVEPLEEEPAAELTPPAEPPEAESVPESTVPPEEPASPTEPVPPPTTAPEDTEQPDSLPEGDGPALTPSATGRQVPAAQLLGTGGTSSEAALASSGSVPGDGGDPNSPQAQQFPIPQAAGLSSGPPTVDVLFVYANGITNAQAQLYAAQATINTNQAFTNSGMDLSVTTANIRAINHNRIPSMGTELNQLRSPTDGSMDQVHGWRDTDNADVVALMVPELAPNGCAGLGYIPPAGEGWDERGFLDMVAGGCKGLVFPHEFGHNMGSHHNPENAKDQTTGAQLYGSYPWGFGHYVDGQRRDLMSYSSQCTGGEPGCPQDLQYADPDDDFLSVPGVKSGTWTRDADRAITDTAWAVSQYRPVRASNDYIWFGNTNGTQTSFNVNADPSWTAGPPFGRPHDVEAPYTPIAGNFDGGPEDVFWFYAGNQPDYLWSFLPGPNRGRYNPYSRVINGSYRPVAGDFDGDGLDDIFWYNAIAGTFNDSIWWGITATFGGPVIGDQQTPKNVTKTTYFPIAGNFNGDAYDDVFWYSPGSGADYIWWGGSSRTGFGSSSVSRTVGGTYLPITGDFDANGADDIMWYKPGSGGDDIWWGHVNVNDIGPADQSNRPVGGTYRPRAGNFDGQPGDDIFWHKPGTGSDYFWWGQTTKAGFISAASTGATANGNYNPVAANMDDDTTDDLYLFQQG